MAYSLPAHFAPSADCVGTTLVLTQGRAGMCRGTCTEPVKQEAASGRWFITIEHPGYNSPANNRSGYASRAKALAALKRCASR